MCKGPEAKWSYWSPEHSSVSLVPGHRAFLYDINSLVFILKAVGSHGQFFRHGSDLNLWDLNSSL